MSQTGCMPPYRVRHPCRGPAVAAEPVSDQVATAVPYHLQSSDKYSDKIAKAVHIRPCDCLSGHVYGHSGQPDALRKAGQKTWQVRRAPEPD